MQTAVSIRSQSHLLGEAKKRITATMHALTTLATLFSLLYLSNLTTAGTFILSNKVGGGCNLQLDNICGCHDLVTPDPHNACSSIPKIWANGGTCRGTWTVDTTRNQFEISFDNHRNCKVSCIMKGGNTCHPMYTKSRVANVRLPEGAFQVVPLPVNRFSEIGYPTTTRPGPENGNQDIAHNLPSWSGFPPAPDAAAGRQRQADSSYNAANHPEASNPQFGPPEPINDYHDITDAPPSWPAALPTPDDIAENEAQAAASSYMDAKHRESEAAIERQRQAADLNYYAANHHSRPGMSDPEASNSGPIDNPLPGPNNSPPPTMSPAFFTPPPEVVDPSDQLYRDQHPPNAKPNALNPVVTTTPPAPATIPFYGPRYAHGSLRARSVPECAGGCEGRKGG